MLWRSKEISKLQRLGARAESRVQAVNDKVDTIIEMCEGVDTVPDLLDRIKNIFKDFDDDGKPVEAVVLGTIHKLKGMQASRVFILHPELMPHPMAGPNFMKGELCAIYVAVTRAKWSKDAPGELFFVGPVPYPIEDAMPSANTASAYTQAPAQQGSTTNSNEDPAPLNIEGEVITEDLLP